MTRLDRKSDSQANAEALARRSATYADEARVSWSYTQDRVATRPTTKRGLLRWAQREARLDGPLRLHGRGIADDGAPNMTGEAKQYLGMTHESAGPTNWLAVACQRDADGDYIAPMRAAIARIHSHRPISGSILARLVVEFCDEGDALRGHVPGEMADDVVVALLNRLYDTYTVRPYATKSRTEVLAS